jgi:alkanesulfonate monooxygenase SsuD/methylene tetrahydromethanopterin reductase-like flavin-dependent oxidoreductase (luciferase family)
MLSTMIRFDMRAPFGTPHEELYPAALEMAAWADRCGIDVVMLSEHHGTDDGYCAAPVVLAAAMAARTERIRLRWAAVLLPLHDPVSVAEQVAVLDQVCAGRSEIVLGAGYVPSEFAMFGARLEDRAAAVEERTTLITRALEGEVIERNGLSFQVTPRPVQRPRPPVIMGGGVAATARRAARLADGFYPTVYDAGLVGLYEAECRALGREPGPVINTSGPLFVHVADDPEQAWSVIGPHALHELNAYGRWAADAASRGMLSPFQAVDDVEAAKQCGLYRVVTPDECVALARELEESGTVFVFHPLMGGLPPAFAWESLELFEKKVMPQLVTSGAMHV